jgi:hypothetical protein
MHDHILQAVGPTHVGVPPALGKKRLKSFNKNVGETFWKNVGSNVFSEQILVQLCLKNNFL